ncbi:MAG: ATP-binding protein [Gemmatimonadetes bacterium]|nr:ATP-binding protein [Gemmatimonadota bacterium]
MIRDVQSQLDPRMTFDTFVVGPGNRLASAAARRAADSPAASYNPLFLYSASGLGKSHILNAMAHHSERLNPDARVLYQTLEGYLNELAEALAHGRQEEMRDRYKDLDILLLDDVQFLTGQPEAQEILLRTLDALNVSGSQIVLASDRPPAEIDGLDARLLSRFSGGLMVDISPPEFETRLAIIRRKRAERNVGVSDEVAEAIARMPFRNVRELMGGLNRVIAIQDLEGRVVTAAEVGKLIDVPRERVKRPKRLAGLGASTAHAEPEFEEAWQTQLREAAEAAEAEGFNASRLRRVLDGDLEPADPERIVADYHAVLDELRRIQSELDMVGNPWPEAARGVLTDPERLEEARALLASARERVRDFPPFRDDRPLDTAEERFPALAVKAAREVVGEEPPEYNPLFVWSPDGHGARELLEAIGTTFVSQRPRSRVALISAREFADEFVTALSEGVAGAWRERWWTVELLMVHQAQELSQTERAQDEFFHLFEAVKRRGARIVIAADRPPSRVTQIDDRLRSRFEGGLVVQMDVTGEPPLPAEELLARRVKRQGVLETSLDSLEGGGEVGPDLGLVKRDEDGRIIREDEAIDPAFQSALASLEGGSERHALTPPEPTHLDVAGPAALTKIKIRPDDFPTLLTEKRRWQKEVGIEDQPAPEPVAPAAAATPAPPHRSPESGEEPTEAPQPATADLPDPAPVIPHQDPEYAEPWPQGPIPVSELSDIIDAILAPFDQPQAAANGVQPTAHPQPRWRPSPEKVVWDWPRIEDRIVPEDA